MWQTTTTVRKNKHKPYLPQRTFSIPEALILNVLVQQALASDTPFKGCQISDVKITSIEIPSFSPGSVIQGQTIAAATQTFSSNISPNFQISASECKPSNNNPLSCAAYVPNLIIKNIP